MLAFNTAITVLDDATMYTRYLSLDTTNLVQGAPGVDFTLKNIANLNKFMVALETVFEASNYNSGTLQMDYENNMQIVLADGGIQEMKAQICRYADPTNLFAGDSAISQNKN